MTEQQIERAKELGWNDTAHRGIPCRCSMCLIAAQTILDVMDKETKDDAGSNNPRVA